MLGIHRKIRCPRHFMLKGGIDPRTGMKYQAFKMMVNPELRNVPQWAFEKWPSLLKYVPYKNPRGERFRDSGSFFQPCMSASFFIHQVYDPKNTICIRQCKKRCMAGLGKQSHRLNPRLSGAGATS